MALGLTHLLTEMSTRNICCGVKAAGAQGWQPYHIHVPIILKSRSLNLLEPSRTVKACNWIVLPLTQVIGLITSAYSGEQRSSLSTYSALKTSIGLRKIGQTL